MSEARMTAVFEYDLAKHEGNPFFVDTPFGRPLVLELGDYSETDCEGDDLAQAPALWTQAQQIAFARAYDAEDAAQRGEPTPWVDGEDAGEWADERVACVRAGLAALEAPDAGVVELVEALGEEYVLDHPLETEQERMGRQSAIRGVAVRMGCYPKLEAGISAALAKMETRA